MRTTTVALAALLAWGAVAAAAPGATTVILVRHAEKECSGGDVPLKPEGTERALELPQVVEGADVRVAIHSNRQRTRLTLAPAIEALGLPSARVLVRTAAAEVAKEILTHQRGRTVLVAGHSDTVPRIIEALGAPSICPGFKASPGCVIPDPEFHHLFVVTVPPADPPASTLVWASYGGPSLPGAGCH